MNKNKIKAILIPSIVLVLGLVSSALLFHSLKKSETITSQANFNRDCELIKNALKKTLDETTESVRTIKLDLISHKVLTREQFKTSVDYFLKRVKPIRNIGYGYPVPYSQRNKIESQIRAEGFNDFNFQDLEGGKLVKASVRDWYYPLVFIEPFKLNKQVLGFDNGSRTEGKDALDIANAIGEFVATEPIELIQDFGKELRKSYVIFLPVYSDEIDVKMARRLHSYFSMVIDLNEIINQLFINNDINQKIGLELIDHGSKKTTIVFSNISKVESEQYQSKFNLVFANRKLQLRFSIPFGATNSPIHFVAFTLPIGIALITCLLSILLYKNLSDNSKELEEINKQLEIEVKERQQAEENLKIFEYFFNISTDYASISRPDGYFELVNPQFKIGLGYSEEELMEKPSMSFIHPDDLSLTIKEGSKISVGKSSNQIINRYKKKNGDYVWLHWSTVRDTSNGKFYSTARDITELKTEGDKINSLLEFQNAILNGTEYSIIATNSDGIITAFNKGAEQMLGYKAQEIINIASPAMFHDEKEVIERAKILSKELNKAIEPGFDVFVEKSKLGHPDVNEWTYIHKDGSRFMVELSVTTLRDQQQNISGFLGIAKDITENIKARKEIIKAKEAAEQANTLKESFLANMSHEIRTPMNAIIGFTDLLLKQKLGIDERKYLQVIKNSGRNLMTIVNDILDISKIEARLVTLEEKPLSISELFISLKEMLRPAAKDKNIDLSFICDSSIPLSLIADSVRLTQILINLINNAIKFTKTGGVQVFANMASKTNEIAFIQFVIIDTGIGIEVSKLEVIFERFHQAEDHITRTFGGTGLGLSISKELVELMGGELTVESKVNVGSKFKFTIPFKLDIEKHNNANININKEIAHFDIKSLNHLKILLVEDNPINVMLIMSLFSENGMTAQLAENGKDAVEKLKNESFDIVLMDIEMPIMNGFQATEFIRNQLHNNIPIIAMTANAMSGEKEKCLSIGMNDYISKPFEPSILFEKIHSLTIINESNVGSKNLVNLSFLVKTTNNNHKAITSILELFLIQVPNEVELLELAIKSENYSSIKSLAHKMKSSVQVIGLNAVTTMLVQLEDLVVLNANIEEIKTVFIKIKMFIEKAIEELNSKKNDYL